MTEDPGRYDPRPPADPGRHGDPQPLGDLLRQYVIDHDWTQLLDATNGQPQQHRRSGRNHE